MKYNFYRDKVFDYRAVIRLGHYLGLTFGDSILVSISVLGATQSYCPDANCSDRVENSLSTLSDSPISLLGLADIRLLLVPSLI